MQKKIIKIFKITTIALFLFLGCQNNNHIIDNVEIANNYTYAIFDDKPTISDANKDFILKLIPLVQISNQSIILERTHLKLINDDVINDKKIKRRELKWLKTLEIKYTGEIDETLFENDKETVLQYLSDLLMRVDIIPIRLVLAQAAIESGWGNSRFCLEGNAYFGIHCYNAGCGVEVQLIDDARFEVKKYADAQESVQDYLLFLNSKRRMQPFRFERVNYLHKDKTPDLIKLASELKGYSADNDAYLQMIGSILKNYIPEKISDY